MSRPFIYALGALFLGASLAGAAHASPNCLGEHKAFKLSGDSIAYSMVIAPGAGCIQGLRWSTMQIYAVWVLDKPAHGELVPAGPAFRYLADPNFSGADRFSLVVVGKNLREEGYSTVEVAVTPPPEDPSVMPSVVSHADFESGLRRKH
ncbi:MAG TPA: hypothetical protein VGF82_03770 [Terracidiphilus sp.]